MRKIVVSILVASLGLLLAACGSASGGSGTTGSTAAPGGGTTAATTSCSSGGTQRYLYQKGYLTVATDSPVYWPWFFNNKPTDTKGYESAVAYAIAKQMGFTPSQVRWAVEPFNSSYSPGPKKFDFDINEISYTAARAQQVTFSNSYYGVQQALVATKGSKITTAHTAAELKTYLYGDQIGTTSLTFITTQIKPTQQPHVYNSLNDVKSALDTHRIDGFVTDTPTAQYITSSQIPGTVMVAQFPSTGEHYGLLFQKGDKLVTCVNSALSALTSNGTLARLQHTYLKLYLTVPTIKP
jgi:polar amino acid transport system substrate-binding protein